MKRVSPRALLRILQLPFTIAVILAFVLCALLQIIPVDHVAARAAFTLAILGGISFLWSGSNLLTTVFWTYVSLVFLVAYPAAYTEEGATLFLVIILGFTLGRTIDILDPVRYFRSQQYTSGLNSDRVPLVLKAGIFLKFACLAFLLVKYGPSQFYSGAYLADAIQTYATGSSSEVVINAAQYLATILCVSGAAIYAANAKPSRYVLGFVFIGLPLLTLSRGDLISGTLCIAYIYRKRFRVTHFALLATLGLAVAVIFGGIRQRQLGGTGSAGLSVIGAVAGELSVSLGVHLIAETVKQSGIVGGRSIIGPILTMPIPRSLFPGKPLLTAAEIMMKYFPDQAESGFYLAPTIFGDWLYNFGIPGVLLVSGGLGYLIRRVDKKGVSFIGVILSYSIFSLLRSNTAQSFLFIFACFLVLQASRVRLITRIDAEALTI